MDHLIAARPNLQTVRAYWTMSRADSERAFRAARRHSRLVRLLRLAVPLTVVIVLGAFFLWTWFNPMRLLFKIPDLGGDLVISGTKITMQQPRVTGYTRDARPYEFSAKSAAQDLTRPDVVELSDLHGKFQMHDNSTTEITAENGSYNSKKEMLELGRRTVVASTSGYKVLIDDAVIDIRGVQMVTERPVQVEMRQGKLDAARMEVREAGALLRFDDVKMTIKPPEPAPAGASAQ